MEAVFLKLVNMSLTASWLVLAVLVLRILLKNAPKYIRVILWGLVGIRLIFPFSLESMFSMIPSSQPLPEEFLYAAAPQVNTGIPVINNAINPVITQSMAPTPGASANPTQIWSFIFSQIWILGLVLMVLYAAISYYLVYRRVAASIRIGKNLRLCDHIESPFILGIIMPQIYLPSELDPKTADLVLAHEYAHLKRKDHWWKPVGFALLCVYWFNPVMWLAYILLCRDIELACDEKVVRELGTDDKKAYSSALLRCSVNRKMIAACPLAFGEVGVKDRIKTVLNYKKPAFWVIVAAVVICIVVAVCFLTDPLPSREFPMTGHNISDMDVDTIVKRIQKAEALGDASAYMNSNNFTLTVDSEFNWVNSQTIRYFFYKDKQVCSAQLRVFPEENQYNLTESSEWVEQKYHYHLRHYLDALKNLPQNAIRRIAPADRYLIELVDKGRPSDYERLITYDANGVCEIEGWFIHLRIMPLHDDGQGYSGTGDETIDLFYGQADNSSAGYITVTETPKYYLTIPCEGVFQIEISTKISSGGCVNADDTCFKKGERVHLEQLDGMEDLRGIHVVVYDRQGVILNVISIPEAKYAQPVNTISEHGWFLGPDGSNVETLIFYDQTYTETIAMVPTDTKLMGLHAGILLLPIEEQIYRYELTDQNPVDVTLDKMLFSFKEPDVNKSINWYVYSLSEYSDFSIVIMLSDTNDSWLCTYTPPRRCSDTALIEAVNADYVVMEDGIATHGQETWLEFYEIAQQGKPASVNIAHYYTLDPTRCDTAYYEAANQDYPFLNVHTLSYDGNIYTLSFMDGNIQYIETYEYLTRYRVINFSSTSSMVNQGHYEYILTHDNQITREQLFGSLISSQAGAYIDHFIIYAAYE